MTSLPFAPSPPNDLVVPERGSTTARAVSSLALRKLFDWLKSADTRDLNGGFSELQATVRGFLPGRPKTVAALLAEPSVSAPLRLLRLGADDPARVGDAALDAARRRLAGEPASAELVGASFMGHEVLVSPSGSPYFLEWAGHEGLELGAFVDELRRAHALLEGALPGVAEALERVARVLVPTDDPPGTVRIAPHAPNVLGIPPESSPARLAGALARAAPTALLFLLRELDPIGDDPSFEALVRAAARAADLRLAEVLTGADGGVDPGPKREAFSAAFEALEPLALSLSPVGVGVFHELARLEAMPVA